jgi:uncharacterized protein YjdB
MRIKFLFGAFLLLLTFGALPAVDAQVGRKIYLPVVARDSTPTPTPTPTPLPVQDVRIQYRAFVQDRGWLDWQNEGGNAGTTGESRRIEAFEMRVVQGPPGTKIKYRALVQDFGWEGIYREDGQTSGTTNTGKQIEAIQVGLELPPGAPPNYLHLEPYVADWQWIGYVRDFWIAGTVGQSRRMEAFHAYVSRERPEPARIQVAYNANPRGVGYQGWRRNGEEAGTRGESRPLNTFKAVLFNYPEGMKIDYRCYVQDQDWQAFTDGECGNFSADKDIYAVEMRLLNPYPGTVLSYTAHIANRGDVGYASDSPGSNPVVGNPSDRFRIESIRIGIGNSQP